MTHTPTPWKISPGHAVGAFTVRQDGGEFQRPVAEIWHNGDDPKDNAEFIVTAVNAFEANQARIAELEKALSGVRANLVRLAWEENSLMIEGIDAALSIPS